MLSSPGNQHKWLLKHSGCSIVLFLDVVHGLFLQYKALWSHTVPLDEYVTEASDNIGQETSVFKSFTLADLVKSSQFHPQQCIYGAHLRKTHFSITTIGTKCFPTWCLHCGSRWHVQHKEWLTCQSNGASQPIVTFAVDANTFSQQKNFKDKRSQMRHMAFWHFSWYLNSESIFIREAKQFLRQPLPITF